MNFENLNCDGCNKPLKGEEIVTCPVCGTPQHRECYNALGCCVNESKHELGFEWENPTDNKVEKVLNKPFNPVNEEKQDSRADRAVKESLAMGELPDVDDVVEQRVNAICPGITPEQRKEQVCGNNIDITSAFIGNNAPRYVDKFRRMERGASSFNWAAFVFAPYWFFYRKLYKIGIVAATIDLCITLVLNYFMAPIAPIIQTVMESGLASVTEQQQSAIMSGYIPLVCIEGAYLLLRLVFGFFGNRWYYNYCKKSIEQFKLSKLAGDNEFSLKFFLSKSSTSILWTAVSFAVLYFLPSVFSLFMQ